MAFGASACIVRRYASVILAVLVNFTYFVAAFAYAIDACFAVFAFTLASVIRGRLAFVAGACGLLRVDGTGFAASE